MDGERVMHIDTSGKLYEDRDTGIAYKIFPGNYHEGIFLSKKFKRELRKRIGVRKDYARLYAICICQLIYENLGFFDTLVICGDEHVPSVKHYLNKLLEESADFRKKRIMSIADLRLYTGNQKYKSLAHNDSNSYRRKGGKKIQRKNKGKNLNVVNLSFNRIKDLWNFLEK